jgi:hypothetical protein
MVNDGKLTIEKLGGLAGIGRPGSRLVSMGEIDVATLPMTEREALERLFDAPPPAVETPDGFRYRLTDSKGAETRTVEVSEHQVPDFAKRVVITSLRGS